jgi:hypothetical protein
VRAEGLAHGGRPSIRIPVKPAHAVDRLEHGLERLERQLVRRELERRGGRGLALLVGPLGEDFGT